MAELMSPPKRVNSFLGLLFNIHQKKKQRKRKNEEKLKKLRCIVIANLLHLPSKGFDLG